LVNKEDYVKSPNQKDFEGNNFTEDNKERLVQYLPDLFWLSEITLPDLYTANKSKIVDFFYGCNLPSLENTDHIFQRWIQIRFPHAVIIRDVNGSPSASVMSVKSHYPVLRLGKEQDVLDW